MKYLVYSFSNSGSKEYLVRGSINKIKFDGDGKPFQFSKKQSELLCEELGYLREEVK